MINEESPVEDGNSLGNQDKHIPKSRFISFLLGAAASIVVSAGGFIYWYFARKRD